MNDKLISDWHKIIANHYPIGQVPKWLLQNKQEVIAHGLFLQAVIANRKDLVRSMIHIGIDINQTDEMKRGALHYAAFNEKRLDMLKLLCAKGARQLPDEIGNTPLHYATSLKNQKAIRILLRQHKDTDLTSKNKKEETVLKLAINDHNCKVIKLLLNPHVAHDLDEISKLITNPEVDDNEIQELAFIYLIGRAGLDELKKLATTLHFDYTNPKASKAILTAVSFGRRDILAWLNRELGLSLDVKNDNGIGPVLKAAAHGQIEMLRELVKPPIEGGFGLSLDVEDSEGYDPISIAVENGKVKMLLELLKPLGEGGFGLSLDVEDNKAQQLVVSAVTNNLVEMLHVLVGLGLSLDLKDNQGNDPILIAAAKNKVEMLHELHKPLNKGGFGLSLDTVDKYGNGPVLTAAALNKVEILHELVKPKTEGGFGLSIHVKNKFGSNPVLVAASNGATKMLHELVKPKTEGGFGLLLNVKDTKGRNPVLKAVGNGQIEMLHELVKPKHEGGFGLSLDIKDALGANPVLRAVEGGRIEMLRELVKPKPEGGFGLSLNTQNNHGHCPIMIAVTLNEFEMLRELVKPIKEGGFELFLVNLDYLMRNAKTSETTIFIFNHHFNHLLQHDVQQAIDWSKEIYKLDGLKINPPQFKELIINRYKELIQFYLHITNDNDTVVDKNNLELEMVINAFREISMYEVDFYLGEIYSQASNFAEAFEYYRKASEYKEHTINANIELVNLIFSGYVVLKPDGTLDEEATYEMSDILSQEEKRSEAGSTLEIMQDRAIKAYEYLPNDSSEDVLRLKNRLDQIMAGNLNVSQSDQIIWQPSATNKYREYYFSQKKFDLLGAKAFNDSLDHILREYQKLSPSIASPRSNEKPGVNNNNVSLFFAKKPSGEAAQELPTTNSNQPVV